MKKTQRQIVIDKLKQDGFITRNECLARYISRLGAIICDMKHEGWDIEPYRDGKDYGYRLIKPATKFVSRVVEVDGRHVETRVAVPI